MIVPLAMAVRVLSCLVAALSSVSTGTVDGVRLYPFQMNPADNPDYTR